ncbi:MAG: VOC family protein [Amphritea sp.]
MAITLNHTIVAAYDRETTAAFYCRIFGFENLGEFARFSVVRVNATLTLDFANKEQFDVQHYAFKVSDQEFDEIFNRIKGEKISYGSGPATLTDMQINHNYGGRGVYFCDANGHVLEILTADYEI